VTLVLFLAPNWQCRKRLVIYIPILKLRRLNINISH